MVEEKGMLSDLSQQVWVNNNPDNFMIPFIKWTEVKNGTEINYSVVNPGMFFNGTSGIVIDGGQNEDGTIDIVVEVMPH